jgi:RNA polymerase sigma-70 factor (ECF subfamily)
MSEVSPMRIGAARAGDWGAREAVVRRVGRIALPLAVAVLRDRDLAGEVAQDVAVDVLRGLHSLRDPAAFDAWVRRIAVRRTFRAAKPLQLRLRIEQPLDHFEGTGSNTVEHLDLREDVVAALGELPPRQRVALVLRYVHGLPEADIEEAMDCRLGTASSLLARGRAALRQSVLASQLDSGGAPDVA